MQTTIDRVRGCTSCEKKLDVVVLRASGSDGYNPYFMGMKGVDSVVSLVITDRATSSRPDVVDAVRNAELVFFAGGDQCNYVRWIKETPVKEAVKSVYARGGAVGGTSAGLAIQGDILPNSIRVQIADTEGARAAQRVGRGSAGVPRPAMLGRGREQERSRARRGALLSLFASRRVVFMTGHLGKDALDELLRLPNIGLLQKPFNIAELLDALASVSGGGRTPAP